MAGASLAEELGISLRTLYRDIETLKAEGAHIEGEPGVGYVLRPGFMLPPLMFSEEEIEALVLGSRWVSERADETLGRAARNALAKIGAVLPDDLRDRLDDSGLLVGRGEAVPHKIELPPIRDAIRRERKLRIDYVDVVGAETRRIIWPIALAFFERVRVVVAWCELREDFRHFRTDRIAALKCSDLRYPKRRQALIKDWRLKEEGSPE